MTRYPRPVHEPESATRPQQSPSTPGAELADWLSGLRGSRVSLRVPQRGDKRALAETVHRNAVEALTQHKLRRSGDLTARSAAPAFAAGTAVLAGTVGVHPASVRVSPELLAATEPAASPRSDLGLI